MTGSGPSPSRPRPVVVMGVSGSGKSTLGALLARRRGAPFVDGDSLHPPQNRAAMAAGHPLTDEQRLPWLHAVGEVLERGSGAGVVVACSALRRRYRDLLREHAPDLFLVDAEGDLETIRDRVSRRSHEFMPSSLLQSQFDALEPREDDEAGITVDVRRAPEEIVEEVQAALGGP